MRVASVLAVACLSGVGLCAGPDVQASIRKSTNIPAQELVLALKTLARERGFQVVFRSEVVGAKHTQGAVGELTTTEALLRLLEGTNLVYSYLDEKTVTILPVNSNNGPDGQRPSAGTSPHCSGISGTQFDSPTSLNQTGSGSTGSVGVADCAKNYSWVSQALADATAAGQASPVQSSGAASSLNTESREKGELAEIVVTAQKRTEKLIDVPASISVLGGDRLESLQSNSLTDFSGYVPGFTAASGGSPGQNYLVIRGLSTGSSSSTGPLVASYIDDVPVSSSTRAALGSIIGIDLLPYDIERIEVLRGPQGTLYGASAMGGLVKYSLKKPDLTRFEARMGGDLQTISGSGKGDWGGRGSVNLPLIVDTFGVRLSGFYSDNAGYIDNIGTGKENANRSTSRGGRATALWQPTRNLSVQATILAQDLHSADQAGVTLDAATFEPVYGARARSTNFPEAFDQTLRAYALSINWDLGFATLTNSASWSRLHSLSNSDLTPIFAQYVPYPNALVNWIFDLEMKKLTEEVRLTSPDAQRIKWMIGAFYTKEDGVEADNIPSFTQDHVPLSQDYSTYIATFKVPYKERALYGNATLPITERIDVGGGARYAQNTETDCIPIFGGILGSTGPSPCTSRPYTAVTTWMANTRYHLNRDSMVYVTWATGYRAGGCNLGCAGSSTLHVPGAFGPDRVANYETGFKGQFLQRRLQLDLSAFHIDWTDIQATLISDSNIAYTGNGSKATSNGAEMTTSFQVSERFFLQATLAYTDAHLTVDALAVGGRSGDQLPLSPRWSSSLTGEYQWPLSERSQLVFGGGYRYRARMNNQFASSGRPFPVGSQSILDLYAGVVVERISARLYARNVVDDRSYSSLLNATDPRGPTFVPTQPRTVGVSVDYSFQGPTR